MKPKTVSTHAYNALRKLFCVYRDAIASIEHKSGVVQHSYSFFEWYVAHYEVAMTEEIEAILAVARGSQSRSMRALPLTMLARKSPMHLVFQKGFAVSETRWGYTPV